MQTHRTSTGIEPSEGEETAGLQNNSIPVHPATARGKGRARKTAPAMKTETLQSHLARYGNRATVFSNFEK